MSDVAKNLLVQQNLLRARLEIGLEKAMQAVEEYVKAEHKFTSRTGKTDETTIGGIHSSTGEKIVGVIKAGMSYNEFLELTRGGKWAFIWPILMAHKDEILPIIAEEARL